MSTVGPYRDNICSESARNFRLRGNHSAPDRFNIRNYILFCALLVLIILSGCERFKAEKTTIILYNGRWESLYINNAIAGFIIEKGYGYEVETIELTEPVLREALRDGRVDVNLEMWQQDMTDWYLKLIQERIIINLGMTFESGPQFWMIPQWVANRYDIKTVFDMQAHWELFRNPENPSKGAFYNCILGWECADINTIKMEAYGLNKYYDIITPGSQTALEASFIRARKTQTPVFGYYWAPTPLMGEHVWYVLEEPPYNDACWKKIFAAIRDKGLRPIDEGCAYQDLPVDKVVHKDLVRDAPEIVEMLKKMVVGLEPLNKTASWAKRHAGEEWQKAAIFYLEHYEERWKTWVTPQAYKEIKKALEQAGKKG